MTDDWQLRTGGLIADDSIGPFARPARAAAPLDRSRKRALVSEHRRCCLDFIAAADEKRCPLMELGWAHVENALTAIGCEPSGLLHDERERARFIEQSKLPVRIATVAGIAEN